MGKGSRSALLRLELARSLGERSSWFRRQRSLERAASSRLSTKVIKGGIGFRVRRATSFKFCGFLKVRWPKGKSEEAVYICEHCTAEIQNHKKQWMLARGEWRAAGAGDGKTAGFHLSSLYSPVGWFSWSDAAAMFEKAQKMIRRGSRFSSTPCWERPGPSRAR